MGLMTDSPHSQPDQIVDSIEASKKELETLELPVQTFMAVHVKDDSFDAVEQDQYKRIYVYQDVGSELLQWLVAFARDKNKKIIAVGLGQRHKHSDLAQSLWLDHDIVPHILQQQTHYSIDELIQSVRLTASLFEPDLSVHPLIYDYNRVIPSYLVNQSAYQQTVAPVQWQQLVHQAESFAGKKIRFFSATPQGGGVALMRHALKRLYRLVDVDMTWHVLYDDPEIFKITKTKFHNVLQNVCPEGTRLTEGEMLKFRQWSQFNAEQFRPKIEHSDVIVIDDPQPAGLIPFIKEWNPQAKLIYRSHIQVEAHLANQSETTQHRTWQFISRMIEPADIFVAHPIKAFVPANVDPAITVTMPAATDPLDGLNKPLNTNQTDFYFGLFNKYLIESGQTPLDQQRDYIIQIARFDPSKGIPDVLEAYRLLCQRLDQPVRPQLVIAGHGSIDDPDGIPILNYVHKLLAEKRYQPLVGDIKVARLPHVDQPLNVLLRNAKVALQLSHKEGFEIKVTEALMKGVPVVAYRTGGIPLQIDQAHNGYLIETGNVAGVAECLYSLLSDQEKYRQVQQAAAESDYSAYQTVVNATSWLYLANQLLQGNHDFGHGQLVQRLII